MLVTLVSVLDGVHTKDSFVKFFGKKDQEKNLQIELLQKKLTELELANSNVIQAYKQLETAADKDKVDALNELAKLEESLQVSQAEIASKNALLDFSNNALFEAHQKIESLKNKIKEIDAQLVASKKLSKDSEEECTLLLHKLNQAEQELVKISSKKKKVQANLEKNQTDFEAAIENHRLELEHLNGKITQLIGNKEALQVELSSMQQELTLVREEKQATQLALNELQAKTLRELKVVNSKHRELVSVNQAAQAELANYKLELEQSKKNVSKLAMDIEQANQDKSALEEDLRARKVSLEELNAQLAQQNGLSHTKLIETSQENELLLKQLMQVQEDLEAYYLDKTKFEKLYQDTQARWARLEKRYPNYVDFGTVELVSSDNLSDVPSITWCVKNFALRDIAFDELLFQIVLQDGQPGIGLVADAQLPATVDSALVPKLIKPQTKQLEQFLSMGQSEFRTLMAATTIMSQLEASGMRSIELPKELDFGFWRQPLKLLPIQLQALPMVLRYDGVKLKRELLNPDYEHLWLEFKGMGLGARTWPKFEIRLGAAMLKPGVFSQFPKYEIPLIDGKYKPFDSWYAESQDDTGAKLELRFSLEKQVFDANVFAKLDSEDRLLLLRLIYAMPDALLRLESEQAFIHRPWEEWVGFAKAAIKVIEVLSNAKAKTKELPAPETKMVDKLSVTLPSLNKRQVQAKKTGVKSVPIKKASQRKSLINVELKAKTKSSTKQITKPPLAAKKRGEVKKTVALEKPAPVKKLVASKKALPTNKSNAAKTPAAKKKHTRDK